MKDKYEISLWEDRLVSASGNVPAHFEEEKICTIGSDTMTSPCRAVEPKLVQNINGTNTFTFKMYYMYNELGEKYKNPFQKLLVNERKIKLFWKNEWYDLILKECQEDSSAKSVTYVCKDLFINELSRTGFDLEFDTELENNQGTVVELAEKILDGTDWQVDDSGSDIIFQNIEEAVYVTNLLNSFTAKGVDPTTGQEVSVNVASGTTVLVFNSVVANRESYLQFWYDSTGTYHTDGSSMLVLNGQCLSFEGGAWVEDNGTLYYRTSAPQNLLAISTSATISMQYRANRLVLSQLQTIDPITGKYCSVYINGATPETEYYSYFETEYTDAITIISLVTNNKYFCDLIGWNGEKISLYFDDYVNAQSYLLLGNNSYAYNSGLRDFKSYMPGGFSKGDKYVFRAKACLNDGYRPSGWATVSNMTLGAWVGHYTYDENTKRYSPVSGESSCFTLDSMQQNGDWVELTYVCNTSCSYDQLDNLALFVTNGNNDMYIYEVQFFKYAEGVPVIQTDYDALKLYIEDDILLYEGTYYRCIRNSEHILPTNTTYWTSLGTTEPTSVRLDPGTFSAQAYATEVWKLFQAGQNVSNESEIVYAYIGSSKEELERYCSLNGITKKFGPNGKYEKIRSIEGKQSNRFNLLQSLAETFEVWIKFTINHDSTGRMVYTGGKPEKFVSFVNEVGGRNGLVFKYGIDLKTITRTINSDQITTKVIVSPNNNQYGKDGFCAIARAKANYPKVNFILNFDYYFSQGLLDQTQVLNDLYTTNNNDYLGYYYWLNYYNTLLEGISDELVEKKAEIDKLRAKKTVLEGLIEQTMAEIQDIEDQLANRAGYGCYCENEIDVYFGYPRGGNDPESQNLRLARAKLVNELELYQAQLANIEISLPALEARIAQLELEQSYYIGLIEELDAKFYSKYSRFIQEGSWTSDDYYDDDLYYYDALSTSYTSSRPQVSYNISVMRISSIPGFENKVFHLGDISYVQDVDFFGYAQDGITPYKEEVVVTEITSNLDSPEKDEIVVQNYKTQFEDLFQRITATTQTLQYTTGKYNNTVNNFTITGELKDDVLQNSMETNQKLTWSSANDSVMISRDGIVISDPNTPANMMKITATGLQLSHNKGKSWDSAITANGIKTGMLTSGYIPTDKIGISDGSYPTFKWDQYGLSAYEFDKDPDHGNKPINIKLNHFVRFDKYGLYGIKQEDLASDWEASSIADIKANASFGVVWDGFFIKSNDHNGYVQITSDNDFQVMDTSSGSEVERIKIGNIGTSANPEYGIRISDAIGSSVLECGGNGELWLKKALHVETVTPNTDVAIGTLGNNQVINVNDVFVVNEDGTVTATNITITGGSISVPIVGGSIGNIQLHSDTSTIGGTGTLDGMTINGGSW